jgi:hypothetical protein
MHVTHGGICLVDVLQNMDVLRCMLLCMLVENHTGVCIVLGGGGCVRGCQPRCVLGSASVTVSRGCAMACEPCASCAHPADTFTMKLTAYLVLLLLLLLLLPRCLPPVAGPSAGQADACE